MRALALLFLPFLLTACSSGSSSVKVLPSKAYPIVPGITNLDPSTPAIDKASFYDVTYSSSSDSYITITRTGFGSFTVPKGQMFIVESREAIDFSQDTGRLEVGGRFNLPTGAKVRIEVVWGVQEFVAVEYVGNDQQVEMYVENKSAVHQGLDMTRQFFSGNLQNGSQEFAITKTIQPYGHALGLDLGYSYSELSNDVDAPVKVSQKATLKITVTNSNVGTASFVLDKVSGNFGIVSK